MADVYRRSSKPLPLFHEGEAPYRSRMRMHHHMEAMEDAQRTPHGDEDEGSSSSGNEEEEDGSEEGEGEEEEDDGDSELGDGEGAAKERRKKRSEAAREHQRIQHKFDSSDEDEKDEAGEEEVEGDTASGPDMSTEAMADRARRAAREDAREEAAEAASALLKSSAPDDDEKDPFSDGAMDLTNVPLASPAAVPRAPLTTSSPAVAAKLAKLALHEDLLEAAVRPRPPHYGTATAGAGSGATSGYNSPAAHAFSPGYPRGGGAEAAHGTAAPRPSHGYSSPIQHGRTPVASPALGRREVTFSSSAEGSGSLTYRHTVGR